MKINLVSFTPNPEMVCARAASLCYKSTPSIKTLRHCVERGHHSILEHASATFLIQGISRVCSHQLVRHRMASYSQVSQRYTDSSGSELIVPPSVEANEKALEIFEEAEKHSRKQYQALVDSGIPKEDARYILPHGMDTEITVTMNFRELLHFFSLRCSPRAQWEIREMAEGMRALCREIAPNVFGEESK